MGGAVKTLKEIVSILAAHKPILAERYRVRSIGVFGSRARNEAFSSSDVDILVELDGPVGWEIVDLRDYLEEILGVEVDLVTRGAVARKPMLWQSIREDLVYV